MSSSLTPEQVEHVAHLARLELTADEVNQAREQLSAVLGYFDRLAQVDTSSVPATLGVQPHSNGFRQDEVRESLPVEQVLQNAPRVELNAFRIPRILDEE